MINRLSIICAILPTKGLRLTAVAVLALLVAACGGVSQPFSKSQTSGRTPPAITLTAMNNIPADKAKLLFDDLATRAGKRDIAIVRGAFQGGYTMTGTFEVSPTTSGTTLIYRWQVFNNKRQLIHSLSGTQTGRIGGADPWSGIDADLLRRIAAFTAESLATRLNELGYATRISGLPPPGKLERAGANADREIDYETVYGPGAVGPPETAALAVSDDKRADLPSASNAQTKAKTTTGKVARAPEARKPASKGPAKKQANTPVAMTRVSGSPGNGDKELLTAMRAVMKSAGWPVLTHARKDAMTVTARVKLHKAVGNTQKVALAWTVKAPGGKVLGTVRQANNVPAGSLNHGWGQAATYVSQAAAVGIFKLVQASK